jgi:fatty acid desaturase
MIFRPSRDPEHRAHRLDLRLWLFGAGAVVALIGMYSGQGWIIYLAVALLAIGIIARFLPRRP